MYRNVIVLMAVAIILLSVTGCVTPADVGIKSLLQCSVSDQCAQLSQCDIVNQIVPIITNLLESL